MNLSNYFKDSFKFSNFGIVIDNLSELGESKKSFYNNRKRHLGFYDTSLKIQDFKQIKELFNKNKDEIFNKVKNQLVEHDKGNLKKVSGLMRNRLIFESRIAMDKESQKLNKYSKSSTSLCDTVISTINDDVIHLNSDINDEAKKQFTKFLKYKKKSLENISPVGLQKLKSSLFTKDFLEMTEEFIIQKNIKNVSKTNIMEYKLLISTLKKIFSQQKTLTDETKQNFNKACYHFIEFLFLAFSKIDYSRSTYCRYYTGQHNLQQYFNNLMKKMLWFYRLVEKRNFFLLTDILEFLDIYVLQKEHLIIFSSNIVKFLEYNKKYCYYKDVQLAFSQYIYKQIIEEFKDKNTLLTLTDISTVVVSVIAKFLEPLGI